MKFEEDQIAELKDLHPSVAACSDGGYPYLFLKGIRLPENSKPEIIDVLLCPVPRDGYPSRLYVSERVSTGGKNHNWNSDIRVLERNWCAFSWKVNGSNLRLAQMLSGHLVAFV